MADNALSSIHLRWADTSSVAQQNTRSRNANDQDKRKPHFHPRVNVKHRNPRQHHHKRRTTTTTTTKVVAKVTQDQRLRIIQKSKERPQQSQRQKLDILRLTGFLRPMLILLFHPQWRLKKLPRMPTPLTSNQIKKLLFSHSTLAFFLLSTRHQWQMSLESYLQFLTPELHTDCCHLVGFVSFCKGNFRRKMMAIVGNRGQLRTRTLSPIAEPPFRLSFFFGVWCSSGGEAPFALSRILGGLEMSPTHEKELGRISFREYCFGREKLTEFWGKLGESNYLSREPRWGRKKLVEFGVWSRRKAWQKRTMIFDIPGPPKNPGTRAHSPKRPFTKLPFLFPLDFLHSLSLEFYFST